MDNLLVDPASRECSGVVDFELPDQLLDWLVLRGLLWVAIVGQPGRSSQLAQDALERARRIEDNRRRLRTAIS